MSERRFQRAEDVELDYGRDLGDPGSFPFTRGRHVSGRSASSWIQRELSGIGSPQESNRQFCQLIAHGAHGLDVIGDTPTMGLVDADHPLAAPAVGSSGVSLSRLADFRALYDGLPLEEISVSHSLPGAFGIAAYYLCAAERGLDCSKLRGSLLQAPLYTEDCAYATHLPAALRMRLTCDSIAFATARMPRYHSFIEDTYFISDGGLDAVEEMAFGFVEVRAVVRRLLARGLAIDSFAPRIGLLVNCRMSLFEEIAKVRATRRIFARMMRDEFGARDPRSQSAIVAVHTSGLTLTAQQPANNIVRGAVQALAMAMAGVQAMEISTFDEAFRTPSPEAHLVALRTQQILALETGVADVIDPLGGSYYIEALTSGIEAKILDMIARIEATGDALELEERGYFRRVIDAAARRYAREVAAGTRPVVGLNVHALPPEQDTLLRAAAERRDEPSCQRADELRAFRRTRDQRRVADALRELRRAAGEPDRDLMPPLCAALDAGGTLGELAGVMREGYGQEYDPFRQVTSPLAADNAA
jgi:methylmalonyl-CoA mutase N-terminal domain/subunit